MDRKSSPERSSPGTGTSSSSSISFPLHTDNTPTMAAAAAIVSQPEPQPTAGKRYRPAPAKTFQCRGYGDCRMVFSRSEHLARHIRKHTGERPFTCHCSKQFSRLDNLRQHAQTVHADKQDQNERMMRDLTSLHATMAAANKIGGTRGGRRTSSANTASQAPPQSPSNENTPHSNERTASPMDMVKQEDLAPISYDGSELYHQSQPWHTDIDNSPKYFQSSLSFSSTGSRPSTSERLPPLSAIVSGSIPTPHQQVQQQNAYTSSFPAHLRPRPSTANRPSSSSSNSATSFYPNPPTNALSTATNKSSSFYPTPPALHYPRSYANGNGYDGHSDGNGSSPTSAPSASAADASPFYFAPPAPAQDNRSASSTSPPTNPRKRAFAGPDGPVHSYDELAAYSTPHSSTNSSLPHAQPQHPQGLDYDYGSESRPQSRRLSVMELCNDGAAGEFVDGFLVNGDRPTTATASALGLVGSTSTMSIFDRQQGSLTPPEHQGRHRGSPVGSLGGRSQAGDEGQGRRMSPPSRRVTPHAHVNGNGIAAPSNGAVNGANGNGYAPPPRPHSTAFSVSSTTSSNSPSVGHHPAYPPPQQQQFAYQQHPQHHQGQPYTPLGLVGAMSSLHPQHAHHQQHPQYANTPTPTPTSAHAPTSYAQHYSPRSAGAAFSPRSPNVGGHLAHQQAQAFQALQQQQQQGYGHGYGGHNGGGYPGEYAHAHAQGYSA